MNLEPFWEFPHVAEKPRSAIQEIRLQVLKVQLRRNSTKGGRPPSIQGMYNSFEKQVRSLIVSDIAKEAILAVKELLDRAEHSPNRILQELNFTGKRTCREPCVFVKVMISLWYTSTAPFIARDPSREEGPDPESLKYGNLGLISMLVTADNWALPSDTHLHEATLIANSATSMIFAAYVLGQGYEGASWKAALRQHPAPTCVMAFLKCSWYVARSGNQLEPGYEFGALLNEVKLARDGKCLKVRVGRSPWIEAAYWHPCKRLPGSPWNKFLRNKNYPIFPGNSRNFVRPPQRIMHRMPSPAIKLAEIFETYYADIRARMD